MIKFYSLMLILLYSCGSHLNYLGSSYTPTKQIDVYVDPAAIKRSYTVIGKGYMDYGYHLRQRIDKMQEKAIAKAKAKGADAILFQDYFVQRDASHLETTTRMDTISRTLTTVENGSVGPVVFTATNILFLKYD